MNQGNPSSTAVGELVITGRCVRCPCTSGRPDGRRYHDSYFDNLTRNLATRRDW